MIVKRLLTSIPLLFVMSVLVFSMIALVPGDAATTIAGGGNASPQVVQQIREELNLDEPFFVQYATWLKSAVQFDFGESLYSQRPVADELLERLPVTLSLALAVFAIVIPLALVLGIVGGLRPGGLGDRGMMFGTSVVVSMPPFWIGMVLISVFSVSLGWLPPYGYTAFADDPAGWARSIILPAVALAAAGVAMLSRQLRAGLADTMQSAYVRTAWAKGGDTRRVVVGHALKNSAIPAATVLGLMVGSILGSTVIVEQIFNIPGIGSYMIAAVSSKDVPVIQATALLFVVAHIIANLMVDISYGYLNPKVRAA
ncbi:ABC transporter permease [Rhodococcus sp. T2V]|uniref:ABC transporter permease n=1 Tax=Rhodococcus sp. T2V TaxID=3034164 RepID=UPI0023E210D4|nr:ABC transporter permease [Rhodococcus sp. T2V]MDF3312215.1 ABC transporter permease [Rhodococcus sp. T2V]